MSRKCIKYTGHPYFEGDSDYKCRGCLQPPDHFGDSERLLCLHCSNPETRFPRKLPLQNRVVKWQGIQDAANNRPPLVNCFLVGRTSGGEAIELGYFRKLRKMMWRIYRLVQQIAIRLLIINAVILITDGMFCHARPVKTYISAGNMRPMQVPNRLCI